LVDDGRGTRTARNIFNEKHRSLARENVPVGNANAESDMRNRIDAAALDGMGGDRPDPRYKRSNQPQKQTKPVKNNQPRNIMNKGIGLALLAVGAALIIFGVNASESAGSEVSRFFTGTPTDKTMWLLIAGIAAAIVGAVMTFRPSARLPK
jgi:hypothetical protein